MASPGGPGTPRGPTVLGFSLGLAVPGLAELGLSLLPLAPLLGLLPGSHFKEWDFRVEPGVREMPKWSIFGRLPASPGPLPTGPARKVLSNAPNINPADKF